MTKQSSKEFIVGLTGGIGAGKTCITNHFETLGIDVVDADLVSREVVAPGQAALNTISEHFGKDIIRPDGALNRAQLRAIIFKKPEEKSWLEALLHPTIRKEIERQLTLSKSTYTILSSPLLLETKQKGLVDRILVIDVPEATQVERASQRDIVNPQHIQAIMSAQCPRDERLRHADDIIDNSGSLEKSYEQVDTLHKRYLKIAQL